MGAVRRALVGYGLLLASVNPAAADPIKLRVADFFPKGHYLVKLVLEPGMDRGRRADRTQVLTTGRVTPEFSQLREDVACPASCHPS